MNADQLEALRVTCVQARDFWAAQDQDDDEALENHTFYDAVLWVIDNFTPRAVHIEGGSTARVTSVAFDLDFTPVTEHTEFYACPFCGCVVWAKWLHDHRARCLPTPVGASSPNTEEEGT